MCREKERERSQSTVKEVYHYKMSVKLTLVKLDFNHLEYKGMQSQEEKEENKQREGKTKIIRGNRSRNQNEKAHSQTRISISGEVTNFVSLSELKATGKSFWKRFEYSTFGKPG